jgi:hypothetical protein
MTARFCDDRGAAGFSWIVDEPATRTSHALADEGRVWLVDPVDWPGAVERARSLGEVAAVVQLLDRHARGSAAIAERLGVPRLEVPASLDGTPFEVIEVRRWRHWQEIALWWPARRTLVVADAIGTNGFYTGGRGAAGVHMLMRLSPPRAQLAGLEPEHLLVGHGEGVHGAAAAPALHRALRTSRVSLPVVVAHLPRLVLDARRRRKG